jgi:hypothetical protein
VPNLILQTHGEFFNIGGDGIIDSKHWQNLGYAIIPGTFSAGVTLTEDPPAVDGGPLGGSFMPWAEYAIPGVPFTVYGEVKGSVADMDDPDFMWEIKVPRITYRINDNARIQCYYLLTLPADGDDDPVHKVKFNFSWYF